MADFTVGSAASLQFAIDGNRVLTTVGRAVGADAPGTKVPTALEAARTGDGVPLTVRDASTAVDIALIAGFGIVAALETLAGAFRLAADSGLVSPLVGLSLDGTRISGVNITAQAGRLVDAIDDLVESAEISNANLISSRSLRVTIQTTEFGGRITVAPQPLDSEGLGIQDLSGITRDEAQAAVARLETAINLARTRLDNLEVLRDSLVPGRGISAEITRLLNSGDPGFLPRGSLVNQIA
ncbi:MAG: hypothetical protein ACE5GT_07170 [Rhodospirillales bacterium]